MTAARGEFALWGDHRVCENKAYIQSYFEEIRASPLAESRARRLVSTSLRDGTQKFGHRAKECSAISANVIATCFALVGFTASLIVGWAAGNAAQTILWRSMVAFAVCYGVGKFIGSVAQRTIDDNIAAYKREHPIPVDPVAANALTGEGVNVDIIDDESDSVEATQLEETVTSRSAA